jgi:hypothetical protein
MRDSKTAVIFRADRIGKKLMRKRRPSILGQAVRTAGRTAVIAGTATAVSGKVAAKRAGAAAPPAGTAPSTSEPAGLSIEAMEQLKKLAELHKSGILTDDEFATQKARILG